MLSHLMPTVLISLYIHPPQKKNNQHDLKNRDNIHDPSDLSQLMVSILVDYILLNEEEYMFGELQKQHKQP